MGFGGFRKAYLKVELILTVERPWWLGMVKGGIVGKTKRKSVVKEGFFKKRQEVVEAYVYTTVYPGGTLRGVDMDVHNKVRALRKDSDYDYVLHGLGSTHTGVLERASTY